MMWWKMAGIQVNMPVGEKIGCEDSCREAETE